MKYFKIYLLFLAGLMMAQCTPKTGKDMAASDAADKPAKVSDKPMQDSKDKSFRSMAPEAGPARAIEIGDYDQFTLDNGLKVIVVENHKIPVISYQLYINRDHLVEGDKAGLTAIVGDLMSSGTTKRSKAEIDEAVDFVGGSLSTNSRGGFASSLTKHSDVILELFAESILSPNFPEEEFEKLRKQTLSGLQSQKDDPNAISGNVSRALLYGLDHPYGEMMTENTVSNLTLEDCIEYYETYFKPNISYMVVVGDIKPAEAKTKVAQYFGTWQKDEVPSVMYEKPVVPEVMEVSFVDKTGAVQSVINISHVVELPQGHPDAIPARVMNTILGSGFSGRLFRNLREDKGYTYGAYSSLDADELVANFSATASVRNEVTDSAVTQFLIELEKMRNEKVTESELELAKNYIAGAFARSMESPQTVANFALSTSRFDLPEDYYETYLEKLDAVTVADVQAMAKKYIKPSSFQIIIVGNKDEVADKLTAFDKKDGKVTFYDIYANEVKQMENTAALPEGIEVINNYLQALGGVDKLKGVKTLKQKYNMSMMGQSINVMIAQKDDKKFVMEMTTQGMTFQKQVLDGEKGMMEQMGQTMAVEGEELEAMKSQAAIFKELKYTMDGYKLETKGVEAVDGKEAYKVLVTEPGGEKTTEFYAVDSKLKLREISTQEGQGQTVTVTNTYADYKAVDGIQFPHTITVSGAAPTPFTMTAEEIKVNADIDDAMFAIE